jgi:hypothetical protein
MKDEFVHNNPQYIVVERFVRLEEKVVDIYCNMTLLMMSLENKIRLFGEVVGSNSDSGS